MAVELTDKGCLLTVVPFTHEPQYHQSYLEMPKGFLQLAGLDGHGQYVVTNEVNLFRWAEGNAPHVIGHVPAGFFEQVQADLMKLGKEVRKVDHLAMAEDIVRRYRDGRER